MNDFNHEFLAISAENGVKWKGKYIPLYIRALIADAPARAFILNHKGHNSASPCSKCKVVEQFIQRTMCFLSIFNEPRSNIEYLYATDQNHHLRNRESALAYLNFNMVTHIPFEYMHLICLGVMKKFVTAIVEKIYKCKKLTKFDVQKISNRLLTIQSYCPYEFARKPRRIEEYVHYKATEFRQLLLYTGPIVFRNILEEDPYTHFLLIHSACRALSKSQVCEADLEFAEVSLKVYVECCQHIYGDTFVTYNTHGLLHVVSDVRILGNLDNYSAFCYEDNLSFFRKFLRKPNQLLQQLYNRLEEEDNSFVKQKMNSPELNHSINTLKVH